ncbi:hypothetical protein AVEN_81719-1 [Araneus ventricosus]|uniref:Uncharacterized protein n=1 Tax=Araneus ventricosus TaxID=182803 RepID=A0A4Y2IB29_ARAVE|nr:hypothetical protein AVEN_81719-1 [Araneus ventricosus]
MTVHPPIYLIPSLFYRERASLQKADLKWLPIPPRPFRELQKGSFRRRRKSSGDPSQLDHQEHRIIRRESTGVSLSVCCTFQPRS